MSKLHAVGTGLFALCASVACSQDGHDERVEYTLYGKTTQSVASVWSSRQDGSPVKDNISMWRGPDDNHIVVQVSVPPDPGTYDCSKMGVASVAIWPTGQIDPSFTANWQTDGSACNVTWERRDSDRMVGMFTAHAGVFAQPEQPYVDVSGNFDVDEPPPP